MRKDILIHIVSSIWRDKIHIVFFYFEYAVCQMDLKVGAWCDYIHELNSLYGSSMLVKIENLFFDSCWFIFWYRVSTY